MIVYYVGLLWKKLQAVNKSTHFLIWENWNGTNRNLMNTKQTLHKNIRTGQFRHGNSIPGTNHTREFNRLKSFLLHLLTWKQLLSIFGVRPNQTDCLQVFTPRQPKENTSFIPVCAFEITPASNVSSQALPWTFNEEPFFLCEYCSFRLSEPVLECPRWIGNCGFCQI